MNRLFIYGTLKKGYPNHDQMLLGEKFICACTTVERYPLVLTAPWYSPVMIPETGKGHRITGELYEVNNNKLSELDEFEYVHLPRGFRRFEVELETKDGEFLIAEAYMRPRECVKKIISEYLSIYQDNRYIHESQR